MAETVTHTRYRVEGMDCSSCASKIDTALRRMPGVADVAVSVTAGAMTVHHSVSVDLGAIEKKVTGLGYTVARTGGGDVHMHSGGCDHDAAGHDHDHGPHAEAEGLHGHVNLGPSTGPWWQSKKALLTIACGAALVAAYGLCKLIPAIASYAFVAAMVVGLIPIARRALMAAQAGTPFSIETLMTIAAVGAVIINAAEEAAALVFLFLVGELLEGVAASKARAGPVADCACAENRPA
jgi:Zn2+/Cd2+-exporting ATPase